MKVLNLQKLSYIHFLFCCFFSYSSPRMYPSRATPVLVVHLVSRPKPDYHSMGVYCVDKICDVRFPNGNGRAWKTYREFILEFNYQRRNYCVVRTTRKEFSVTPGEVFFCLPLNIWCYCWRKGGNLRAVTHIEIRSQALLHLCMESG